MGVNNEKSEGSEWEEEEDGLRRVRKDGLRRSGVLSRFVAMWFFVNFCKYLSFFMFHFW